MAEDSPLLEMRDLSVRYPSAEAGGAAAWVLREVSLSVRRGGSLAVIGESGSGKTTLALSVARLLPPSARLEGRLRFAGEDLLDATEVRLRALRGAQISMVFQQPQTALNPVLRIGSQIAEGARAHGASRAEAKARARELLSEVGLPGLTLDRYPHELSGGMQQRVLIAIALAAKPALLIADEPTTALDVIAEAEILALLTELRERLGLGLLLVTHDVSIARRCETVCVLYGGEVVEMGSVDAVLGAPAHPYTRALLAATPRLGALPEVLKGHAPDPHHARAGCRFAPRCAQVDRRCTAEAPLLSSTIVAGRQVRCFFPHAGDDVGGGG